jgi:DNA ligase-1
MATLDVVVVAAEYGHGKRRGVLSDYTFAVRDETTGVLRTVGKAYTGLTDAEIAQLTEHFLAHTLEVQGKLHRVVPDTVLEIAFDSINPSQRHDSGIRPALSADRTHPCGQDATRTSAFLGQLPCSGGRFADGSKLSLPRGHQSAPCSARRCRFLRS